jgi:hypothetical protein
MNIKKSHKKRGVKKSYKKRVVKKSHKRRTLKFGNAHNAQNVVSDEDLLVLRLHDKPKFKPSKLNPSKSPKPKSVKTYNASNTSNSPKSGLSDSLRKYFKPSNTKYSYINDLGPEKIPIPKKRSLFTKLIPYDRDPEYDAPRGYTGKSVMDHAPPARPPRDPKIKSMYDDTGDENDEYYM